MPVAAYAALIDMQDNYTTRKTDAQILDERKDERTRCAVFTRVMG